MLTFSVFKGIQGMTEPCAEHLYSMIGGQAILQRFLFICFGLILLLTQNCHDLILCEFVSYRIRFR
jgi:hypothetical protein